MSTALVIAVAWPAVAALLGLVVGRGIRVADDRTSQGDDLSRQLDAVVVGLEDDLRAAAAG
ncbi:hypothetical protein [Geodermatophilus sp. SYSU D00710]